MTCVRRVSLAVLVGLMSVVGACGDGDSDFNAEDDPGYNTAALEQAWRSYENAWASGDVDGVLGLTSARCLTERDVMRKGMADVKEYEGSTTLPSEPVISLRAGNRGSVEWTTEVDQDGNFVSGRAEDWIFEQGKGWRAYPCASVGSPPRLL